MSRYVSLTVEISGDEVKASVDSTFQVAYNNYSGANYPPATSLKEQRTLNSIHLEIIEFAEKLNNKQCAF